MREPFYDCPRFDFCSVNDCPLSFKKSFSIPGDPETVCTLSKVRRMKIASIYNLPTMGLKPKEHAAKKRWESLDSTKKNKALNNLRKSKLRARY